MVMVPGEPLGGLIPGEAAHRVMDHDSRPFEHCQRSIERGQRNAAAQVDVQFGSRSGAGGPQQTRHHPPPGGGVTRPGRGEPLFDQLLRCQDRPPWYRDGRC